jgi:hypothetical protein
VRRNGRTIDKTKAKYKNFLTNQKSTIFMNNQFSLFETLSQATKPLTTEDWKAITTAPPAPQSKIPQVKTKEDIFSLIYSNGGNRPPIMRFYEDGSHGWLQVPRSLVVAMGIEGKISGYSYQRLNDVYLEEDCDLSVFLNTLGIEPGSALNGEFLKLCPKSYTDVCDVRSYERYQV